MEAVLGLPDTTFAAADPERDAVIGEVAVQLGGDDAEPEAKENCGVVRCVGVKDLGGSGVSHSAFWVGVNPYPFSSTGVSMNTVKTMLKNAANPKSIKVKPPQSMVTGQIPILNWIRKCSIY